MKNLIIIGARGWGREVFNMLPDCFGYETDFSVKGFLDDKDTALDGLPGYPRILGSVEEYVIEPNDVFVCALGDPKWKKHYAEIILKKGGEFINLIHTSASIQRNTKLGVGCIVGSSVRISCDIQIENFVTFQPYSVIGHDVQIGDYCHLGCRVFMGGFSSLGDLTTLQTSAIILPHIKVGDNCMVGAGSVVIKKVKSGDTVFGNPAKKIDF
jgi:sugar O-acyltransferase (sialic acid O-acetyltransferase NeuD family)